MFISQTIETCPKQKSAQPIKAKKQIKHSVSKTNIWKELCFKAQESLWIPKEKLSMLKLEKQVIIMQEKLITIKTHTTKTYTLYKNHLMISAAPNKRPHSGISLRYVKCCWVQDNNAYKIIFQKAGKKFVLQMRKESQFNKWKEALRPLVLVEDFHEEYKVLKIVGIGTFAKVYKAKRRGTKNFFAVKAFKIKNLMREHNGIEGLFEEVEIMKAIGMSPNNMKFYEIHQTKNSIYLIVEYLEGQELLRALQDQEFKKEKEIKQILYSLLLGVRDLHQKGIMHRDLKPENIISKSKQNFTKLCIVDFGLATFVNKKKQLFTRCGTPGFVAPEIINLQDNEWYNEKCDVFSLGVIFYFLLNGKPPFYCENKKEIIDLNTACDINFNEHRFCLYSKSCMNLLRQMLMKYPEMRPSVQKCLKHKFFNDVALQDIKSQSAIQNEVISHQSKGDYEHRSALLKPEMLKKSMPLKYSKEKKRPKKIKIAKQKHYEKRSVKNPKKYEGIYTAGLKKNGSFGYDFQKQKSKKEKKRNKSKKRKSKKSVSKKKDDGQAQSQIGQSSEQSKLTTTMIIENELDSSSNNQETDENVQEVSAGQEGDNEEIPSESHFLGQEVSNHIINF